MKEEHTKVKLTEAIDLMTRCINSCKSVDQLSLTLDWIADVMIPANFLDDEVGEILKTRDQLFKMMYDKNKSILGVGDVEELDLKTQTIHE